MMLVPRRILRVVGEDIPRDQPGFADAIEELIPSLLAGLRCMNKSNEDGRNGQQHREKRTVAHV
jgi:hypothetical protein